MRSYFYKDSCFSLTSCFGEPRSLISPSVDLDHDIIIVVIWITQALASKTN